MKNNKQNNEVDYIVWLIFKNKSEKFSHKKNHINEVSKVSAPTNKRDPCKILAFFCFYSF
jgi:hypothetical protein